MHFSETLAQNVYPLSAMHVFLCVQMQLIHAQYIYIYLEIKKNNYVSVLCLYFIVLFISVFMILSDVIL